MKIYCSVCRNTRILLAGCAWSALAIVASGSLAEEVPPQQPSPPADEQREVDFRRDVLPVLQRNCLACHSQSEAEAALVLETADSILAGGDSGPAILPGNAEESLLFQLVSHQTEPFMPPLDNDVGAKALTPDQLGLLKRWIEQGARTAAADTGAGKADSAEKIAWQSIPEHYAPIYALDVSADGQRVAAGRGTDIVLYSVPGKREIQRLEDPQLKSESGGPRGTAHLDVVQSLAFSPDGQLLASGGFRCVKIWSREPSLQKGSFQVSATPQAVIASRDGDQLLFVAEQLELRDALGRVTATAEPEEGEIVAAAFLDSQHLVTVRDDHVVEIRARADLAVLEAWPVAGSPSEILAVASIQDGALLIVASSDGLLHLWPRSNAGEYTPEARRELRVCPAGQIRHVVAAADDQLAVVDSQGVVRLWNVTEGRELGQLEAGGPIDSVAVSAEGRHLVAVLASGSAKLWNLQDHEQIRELPQTVAARVQESSALRAVGLKQERHRVAATDLEEAKKRHAESTKSLETSREELKKAEQEVLQKEEALKKATQQTEARQQALQELDKAVKEHEVAIAAIASSLEKQDENAESDRRTLEQQRDQRRQELQKSEPEREKAKAELEEAREQQQQARDASEAAKKAVEAARAALARGEAFLQRTADELADSEKEAAKYAAQVETAKAKLAEIQQHAKQASSHFEQVMFSSDAWRFFLRDQAGRLIAMDSETGEPLDVWERLGTGSLLSAASGTVISMHMQEVAAWNIQPPWTLIQQLGDPADESTFVDRVTALCFSQDGKWLAVGGGEPSRSGHIHLLQVVDGELQPTAAILEAHSDVVYDLEFSPQEEFLASCSSDRIVRLIDVKAAQPVKSFEGHTGHVLGVAWRADGRTLASAGADHAVKIWNVKDGTQQKSLDGFAKEITGVCFLGLEDRLVFASGDGQIGSRKSNGDGQAAFPGYSDYVHRIRSSQDGSVVAAAGEDGVVRVWNAEGKKLVEFERRSEGE